MGNVASVKLKDDIKPLEITEQLVQDFQYHIKLVDHSMAAFARTTESLRETFATVKDHECWGRNSDVNDGASGEEPTQTPNYVGTLEKIDEALSDQSFILVDLVSRFLNFVIETGNKCNVVIPENAILFVDRYKSGTFTDVFKKDIQYQDAIIESMRRRLERANKRYNFAKDDINNLNERERLYQDEKKILKGEINALKISTAESKEELEKNGNEKQELGQTIEKMKSELSSRDHKLGILQNELKSIKDDHSKHVQQLDQDKTDLQRLLNDKQVVIDSLETNLNKEKEHTLSLQEKHSAQIESMEKEKEKLKDDKSQLKDMYDQDIKRPQELIEEIKRNIAAEGEKTLHAMNDRLIEYQLENRKEMIVHETRYKTITSDEISRVNSKVVEVTQSMESIDKGLTQMNNEHKDLYNEFKTENRRLSSCLIQSKIDEGNYLQAICQMRDEIQQSKEENTHSLANIEDSEKENKQLVEKEKPLASEEQNYADILNKCHLEIDTLKKKVEKYLNISEEFIKEAVESENKQAELLSSLLSKHEQGVPLKEEHNSNIESLREEIANFRIENKERKELLMKEKRYFEDKTENVIQSPQKVVEEQSQETQYLKRENMKLSDENENLNKELLSLRCVATKTILVQILHYNKFAAYDVEEQVVKTLQLNLVPEKIDLQFIDMTGAHVLRSDIPVLVSCQRSFGLNRDKNITTIIQTYKDKKFGKRTALVFFHDKDEKKFKPEVGGIGNYGSRMICNIFDIVYSKQRKYECDENTTNIEQILEFVKGVVD